MRLLHDNLLIAPIQEEEKTASGLFLGKAATPKNLGRVVHAGPKVKACVVGKTIKHYDQVGSEIEIDGENYLLLKEGRDVIAVL